MIQANQGNSTSGNGKRGARVNEMEAQRERNAQSSRVRFTEGPANGTV